MRVTVLPSTVGCGRHAPRKAGLASSRRCMRTYTAARTPVVQADAAAARDDVAASRLWSWLQARGTTTKGAKVTVTTEQGLAILADRDCKANEVLATVPSELLMNFETAKAGALGSYLQPLKPWLALAVHLLHERSLGDQSAWAPYLAVLPDHLQLPMFWDDAELAELHGTQLLNSSSGYTQYAKAEFAGLDEYVFKPNPGVFPADVYNEDSFLWAFGILRSRTFAPLDGDAIALVPGMDLANHTARPRDALAQWTVKGKGLFAGSAGVGLKTLTPVAANEQVYVSYGDKTNSELALDYGFVDAQDLAGSYLLTLSIPPDDPFFDDKADVAELAGLGESFQFKLVGRGEPPEEMLTYLRLIQLTGQDSFLLESIFRDRCWSLISLPVSVANETAMCECMVEGCRAALEGYPTTVAQDEAKLQEAGLSERGRMAVVCRLSEKKALLSTMAFFEQRVERVPLMEMYQERRLKDLGLMDDSGQSTYDDFFKDGIA